MGLSLSNKPKEKSAVYPSKKSMNLYYKIDTTTVPATVSLYVLFVLVLLLAAAKFMIYDYVQEASVLQQQADKINSQISNYTQKLSEYAEIEKEYNLYSATEEEEANVSRIQILDLIDNSIRSVANVDSITIQDSSVLVTFSGITLKQSADIVTKLEQSPIVSKIDVDTAKSSNDNEDIVDANIYIQISQEEK